MNYWNKENYNGLKSIGEKYSSIPGYELFGQYCLQKEQGLKKLAIASIREFVANIKTKPLREQKKIAVRLAALGFHNRYLHQILPHPLSEYLKEIFQQWTVDEAHNPIPYQWLGYTTSDISFYEKALSLDPKNEICISQIAQACLRGVDYQTHHLSESLFLGDLNEAKEDLKTAKSLIHRLTTETVKVNLEKRLIYFNRLLDCWETYSNLKPEETFPNWCAAKGDEFNFWSIVYYQR